MLTALISIHRQLSHAMQFYLRTRTVLDLVFSSQVSFRFCKTVCQNETPQENFLPIFVSGKAEEAKIWWSQQVQRRTRSLASDLSDRGSHCLNYEEWLKKPEDTSPTIEAEGQNTMSVSTTKLLENGRDSETSTARVKHSCRCRRCRPRNFPFLTS